MRGVRASFYAAFRTLARSYGSAVFVSILPPLLSSLLLAGGWLLSGKIDLDKYLYQLIGSSLLVLVQIAVGEVVWTIRDYIRDGIYEYMMASPVNILGAFYGMFLAEALVISGLSLALTSIIVGVIKGAAYGVATALAFALTLVGILPVLSIGIIIASLIPLVKDPNVLVMPVGALLTVLSGALYPLTLLPPYLEAAARLLPVADLAEVVRGISLGLKLQVESLGLLGAYMLYVLVGVLALQILGLYARRRGVT